MIKLADMDEVYTAARDTASNKHDEAYNRAEQIMDDADEAFSKTISKAIVELTARSKGSRSPL